MMKEPAVRTAIQEAMKERNERLGLDADYVLAHLHDLFQRVTQEVKPALNSKTGKPLTDPDTGAALYTFNAPAALKALELMGKHVGVSAFKDVSEVRVTATAGEYEERLARVRQQVMEGASD